jgi:DNA-binding transcriptional ArsR family regulator
VGRGALKTFAASISSLVPPIHSPASLVFFESIPPQDVEWIIDAQREMGRGLGNRKPHRPLCAYKHDMAGFDDRTVTLDAPDQLAELGSAFASRTRIAVLAALVRSERPLHINELARRVGVDASPVRTHLELLLKQRLVREVDSPTGRERNFETLLTGVVLTLEGVNRPLAPQKGVEPSKAVVRLQRKLDAMEKDLARLQAKARDVQAEIREEWAKAAADAKSD